jgi:hypothetical protein
LNVLSSAPIKQNSSLDPVADYESNIFILLVITVFIVIEASTRLSIKHPAINKGDHISSLHAKNAIWPNLTAVILWCMIDNECCIT